MMKDKQKTAELIRIAGPAIFFALGTTASILVAQAYGRNDREEASSYFRLFP